jgi:hypothetical protein
VIGGFTFKKENEDRHILSGNNLGLVYLGNRSRNHLVFLVQFIESLATNQSPSEEGRINLTFILNHMIGKHGFCNEATE